ncbi:FadR/GntR family transcriptional regulator [Kaistia granuli]|uniref:FadR/GntR family transcriptional regulator n=1 Tax=Kaistia granuli TaxID=363259 RepID=UPI000361D0C8|nr:FadR/GntR family transcriptional regulator [Kaistia granuli]
MVDLQLKPARREKLSDILYGQILEQIVSGTFAPGDRLPSENDICKAFEVSRPVVREALQRLQVDGLVIARQGAGTFVSHKPPGGLLETTPPQQVASVLRVTEVRIAIETECAHLAATRRSAAQLAEIEARQAAFESALNTGAAGLEEDFAFHHAIAEATGNEVFPAVLDSLKGRIEDWMRSALSMTRVGSDERRRALFAEHRNIVDAISRQQADQAALYMKFHLVEARRRLTDARRDR